MSEELSPMVFESVAAVQRHCAEQLTRYRCIEAEALRNIAVEYELEGLKEGDACERERLIGVAEGLRAAAARLDVVGVPA